MFPILIVELEDYSGAGAKREAIARMLEEFRGSGKQVVGYSVTADNSSYELLCSVDRLFISRRVGWS